MTNAVTESEVKFPTQSEFISRLESVYSEINILKEDIKDIKKKAKACKYNPKKLDKVAKLRTTAKLGEFIREASELIDFVEGQTCKG